MSRPTVTVYTLGCKVNQAETDALRESFAAAGFDCVDAGQVADVCVVNTCTVTREADRKSRQLIRRATRKHGQALVVVTGCYAQTSPQEIARIPGVHLVVPQADKVNLVSRVLERHPASSIPHPALGRLRTRAFIKIQDGCDRFCTYCVVPLARGKPRSEPLDEVVKGAKNLTKEGVKEIVLTGVRLGKYGKDLPGRPSLVDLLRKILSTPKLGRLRLSSLEPEEISPELINLMSTHFHTSGNVEVGGICRHLHIPLQSGDDAILEAMGRNYTASYYEDTVVELKKRVPGIAITADVMVGFPEETEEQFERTRDLVERLGLAKLHVFKYSPRPGTPAASFPDQIPEVVKAERCNILLILSERLRARFRTAFVGTKLSVLVEEKVDGKLTGLSDNYLRAYFDGDAGLVGRLVDIPFPK